MTLDRSPTFVAFGLGLLLATAGCERGKTSAHDTATTATTAPDTTAETEPEIASETEPETEIEPETAPETGPDTESETVDETSGDTGETGDTGAETIAETQDETQDDAGEDTSPPNCEALPATVDDLVKLSGFTPSEDFQFDGEGHWVGVDPEGNIIRVTKDGTASLFIPGAQAAAGMRFLSDGDLVFAGSEALYRATPDGIVTVILGGLAYPNGVEVDLDDFIYVAEQNAGRVRKVDPATGAFTIVARGLLNPNGLSFSPDYKTLYCGSFGEGVVYRIPFDADGYALPTGILTMMPGIPPIALPQGPTEDSMAACATLADGDPCVFETTPGKCVTLGRALYCDVSPDTSPGDPCLDHAPGDTCDSFGVPGLCIPEFGALVCDSNPQLTVCFGGAIDAPCDYVDFSGTAMAGTCVNQGSGPDDILLSCAGSPVGAEYAACAALQVDDPCSYSDGATTTEGTCVYRSFGYLACIVPIPRYPEIVACRTLAAGDPCSYQTLDAEHHGLCQDDFGIVYCAEFPPEVAACIGKQPKDACVINPWDSTAYECTSELLCVRAEPWFKTCAGGDVGDNCHFSWKGDAYEGACTSSWEGMFCQPNIGAPASDSCVGAANGDTCTVHDAGGPLDGLCTGGTASAPPMPMLFCVSDEFSACAKLAKGDPCGYLAANGAVHGVCEDDGFGGGNLICASPDKPSTGALDGVEVDACGNVYVTEYIEGILWRISPDASKIERIMHLPAQWIPNLHWGNGHGGFRKDRLYVLDRDDGSLFELNVGVPGKTRNQP